jgi:Uma2 family endonuclease
MIGLRRGEIVKEQAMEAAVQRHRFTVDEYHWMGRVGIFCEDARVELIDGDIIDMSPIGDRHVACLICLTDLFSDRLRGRASISVQNPVRLGERQEPQPDLVLLRRLQRRRRTTPTADDVLLLIEVADSSLAYDRRTKVPMYAHAGIAEVWIVNLDHDRVEVYREPAGDRYASMTTYERDGVLSLLAFPDITIRCEEILP